MILYGKQIFFYVSEHYPELIEEIYLAKEVDKKLFSTIAKLNHKIIKLDSKKAQSMARGGNHQGFLLKIKALDFSEISQLKKEQFLLVLVGLTDVGNIGAIIRSAYALGVDGVVISGVQSIAIEGIIRTSSGAALDMPMVLFKDTATLVNELKQAGFTTYSADMGGEDVRDVSCATKKALLMGSEGKGIPNRILKMSDKKIKINMQRSFDSLNVSAAAAILCDRMR
ncbi:MAG: 23S rRNA (guanosine(2251)-2'-O)-methyltransferase RlmB [Epsilonproteobacteria bacterium]|nr:23S rRNA (guanosine(2251)-2'-O)-methyltransferase RlmB [Campylobacterota bacterium]